MNAIHLGTWEHDSPEWHTARAAGIGASEIAAVVGLDPWVSAFHLWHQKKGNLPRAAANSAMDWGHRLEPVVRAWFTERHPEFWVYDEVGTFAHFDRNWQRVNPDGLLYPLEVNAYTNPLALLEVKTTRFGDGFGPSGSDEIPLGYRCQVQWALDVFGLHVCHVAVLIGGNDAREYVIEADPEDQAVLREAGERFWLSLENDDEPPIDASHSTYEAVRALHPEIDPDTSVEVDPIAWHEYLQMRDAAASTTAGLQLAKSKLLAAMGTARIATYNDQPVLRRQMSSGGTPYLKEIA